MARCQSRPQPRLIPRLGMIAPLVLGLVTLGLLVGACGGGASPSSVASIGKTKGSTVPDVGANVTTPANPAVAAAEYKRALKFSQCMRSHGVADFPDPNSGGGIQIPGGGPKGDLNPDSATFSTAQNACQKYSPVQSSPQQQAQAQARGLAMAACMRKNGVPNFPDPQFMPGGRFLIKITSNVDPNSPTFRAAQQKCSTGTGTFTAPAP